METITLLNIKCPFFQKTIPNTQKVTYAKSKLIAKKHTEDKRM